MSILDKLERALRNKSLCEIYDDAGDGEKFSVGYVVGYNEEYAVFETFGLLGQYVGYACVWTELIENIVPDTDYTNRIKRLTRLHGFVRPYPKLNLASDVLKSVIYYAIVNEKVCELRLNEFDDDDESLFGYITSCRGIKASMCPLDEDGREEEPFSFDIEETDMILVADPQLGCLALLHDNPETEG